MPCWTLDSSATTQLLAGPSLNILRAAHLPGFTPVPVGMENGQVSVSNGIYNTQTCMHATAVKHRVEAPADIRIYDSAFTKFP